MNRFTNKKVVYKDEVFYLFLLLIQIALRDVKGSIDFEDAFKRRLGFQSSTDWKKFRACVDLLEDTEYAIESAFQFQLGDLSIKNNDHGELYIRLYGILNAVYLQSKAFVEISKLLHYPNPKLIDKSFKELKIYKLRGIAGSHTVDYEHDLETKKQYPKIKNITTFRILQVTLSKTGKNICAIDENNISFEFNLLDVLSEYEKLATNYLIKLIRHSIDKLVHKKVDKLEMQNRLDIMLPNLIDYSMINKNDQYEKEKYVSILKKLKRK